MGSTNFEDLLLEWIERESDAASSLLSLDEWILQRLERNLDAVRSSAAVWEAVLQAADGLPFGFAPFGRTPIARQTTEKRASAWSRLAAVNGSDWERWPDHTLDEVVTFLQRRLKEVIAYRRPPTAAEVSLANDVARRDSTDGAKSNAVASAGRAVDVTRQWLVDSAAWHCDVLSLCSEAIGTITTTRERVLETLKERQKFIEHSRRLWNSIQWLLIGEIEYCWLTGNSLRAMEVERTLLAWLEQFENRVLAEELRSSPEPVSRDESSLGESWEQGTWGLNHPWDAQELSAWTPDAIISWLQEHRSRLGIRDDTERGSSLLSYCLNSDVAAAQPATGDADSPERTFEVGNELESGAHSLEELVPTGCVWIRALFDDEGCLRWWAWVNKDASLVRLACGVSSTGARDRLEKSNQQFDRATDSAWQTFTHSRWHSPPSSWKDEGFLKFTAALKEPQRFWSAAKTDRARQHSEQLFDSLLNGLKAECPRLAESGLVLLDWLLKWHESPTPFPDNAWKDWNAVWDIDVEYKRRSELEAASRDHLAALTTEWNMSALWNQVVINIDWRNTDVLFQVQGPLLAMSLAWLNFGGKPLFEQVASTSTAISLAMRYASCQRVGDKVAPRPRVLSAQWDEPQNRVSAYGLPLFHAAVRRLAADSGWESRSLGDDPIASSANLCSALREAFGVVVIGAHGDLSRAGVKMADDTPWCGDGADLSEVDLLILCCCAVGRLTQRGQHDVEGLYARLAVHGARCVVAARWPIADLEAAVLLGEFLKNYLQVLCRHGEIRQFDRARAFNRARKTLLLDRDLGVSISTHLASAFEIYGLG